MPGRPERSKRKTAFKASVPVDIYERARPLAGWPVRFRSFSQFFEALAFSLKASYVEMPGDDMPELMRDIKAKRLLELDDLTRLPPQRMLHMTLDEEAVEFVDFLCMRFPVVFENRSEAASLMLLFATRYLIDESTAAYFSRRLHEALRMRPAQAGPAKPPRGL